MALTYKKIYAVDFDGTLAVTHFPEIIEPIMPMIETCKRLQQEGNILIMWTCRCNEDLEAAVEFCKRYGLIFDLINENVPENVEKFGNDSRKIFAHVYIDDKTWNPEHEDNDNIKHLKIWQEFEETRQEATRSVTGAFERIATATRELVNKFTR